MTHGYLYQLLRKLGLSTFGASTGEFVLVKPIKMLVILGVALVIGRLGSKAIRHFIRGMHSRAPLRRLSARAEQRAATAGDVLASMFRIAVWSVALLTVLNEFGVNLAPLLAGAGIAGVAVGFGAQSLVKDFFSGLFILIEDQFGVGDTVTLAETTGTVEDVSLRVTRVRSVDGTVWFVPNGELRKVGNSSMDWSRAMVDVLVAYDSDLADVTRAIEEAAADLAADPAWRDALLEPPEVWGVHATGADGVTMRVVVKAVPARRPAVTRELRGRVTAKLRQAGVKMPGGPTMLMAGPPEGSVAPTTK